MKKRIVFFLVLGIGLFYSCQKELSFENSGTLSAGTLQSDINSDCLPKTVNGTYEAGKVLVGTANFIQVEVVVTKIGSYTIYTDTVNGYYFRASGIFTDLGVKQLTLKATGTPVISGTDNFDVYYGQDICTIDVTVLPSGSGGPAVGTLAGAPNLCTPFTLNGAYAVGTALTFSHNVRVQLNITTAGSYNITTDSVSGFWFSAAGSASAGNASITLNGNGTPSSGGTKTFTVKFGSSTCTFTVNVGNAGAAGTLGGSGGACMPANVNGTYVAGTILSATNTVAIQVNVTTPGVFSITTIPVNGYSFSFSGNLTASGTVTLIGNGTPAVAGSNMFTVTLNSTPVSTCTFTVTVTAAPTYDYFPRTTNSNWSYEFDDIATDSSLNYVIAPTINALGNTYKIFMFNDGTGPDSSDYYRKSAGNYFRYSNLGFYLAFDNDQFREYIFLKDDQPAGHTWYSPAISGTIGGNAITIRIKFTILLKDVTIPVTSSLGTVNYQNTIVVEERYEAQTSPTTWIPLDATFGYFKNSYSRDKGWILSEYYNSSNAIQGKMELRRFAVY